jgi:hypothetical protein
MPFFIGENKQQQEKASLFQKYQQNRYGTRLADIWTH